MMFIYKCFYGFYIYNCVLIDMIIDRDGFYSIKDFMDFIEAGKHQIKKKFKQ